MSTPRDGDRTVWPILWHLQQCVAYQLGLAGRPVCHFPIYWHSRHPAADACDCTCEDGGQGQAWVRMVQITRSAVAPARLANCANGVYDLRLELGVYRCAPVPEGRSATVPEPVESAHAAGMYRDAEALRAALRCCATLQKIGIEPTLVSQSPIGPSGACAGVELQAELQVTDCACPPGSDHAPEQYR